MAKTQKKQLDLFGDAKDEAVSDRRSTAKPFFFQIGRSRFRPSPDKYEIVEISKASDFRPFLPSPAHLTAEHKQRMIDSKVSYYSRDIHPEIIPAPQFFLGVRYLNDALNSISSRKFLGNGLQVSPFLLLTKAESEGDVEWEAMGINVKEREAVCPQITLPFQDKTITVMPLIRTPLRKLDGRFSGRPVLILGPRSSKPLAFGNSFELIIRPEEQQIVNLVDVRPHSCGWKVAQP